MAENALDSPLAPTMPDCDDRFSIAEVLEILARMDGRVAFAQDGEGKLAGLSSNAFRHFGAYAAELHRQPLRDLMHPLSPMPRRRLHGRGGAEQLYCWRDPIQVCGVRLIGGVGAGRLTVGAIRLIEGPELRKGLARAAHDIETLPFAVCLADPLGRLRYMNQAAKDLNGGAALAPNATIMSLFDKFGPLPKRWELDEAIEAGGRVTFAAQLPEAAALADAWCEAAVAEIEDRPGSVLRVWLILPEVFRDVLTQYLAGDAEASVDRLLGRVKRSIAALYRLGFDPDQVAAAARGAAGGAASGEEAVTNPIPLDALSRRQGEILHCLAKGMTYEEIAEALKLRLPTVKTHVAALDKKLTVRNKAEALMLAEQKGWLPRLRQHY